MNTVTMYVSLSRIVCASACIVLVSHGMPKTANWLALTLQLEGFNVKRQ
jgi:UDP-N-acetyl-D-mannosaminuronic acid transferase (WecB/TagA/CpsF family)